MKKLKMFVNIQILNTKNTQILKSHIIQNKNVINHSNESSLSRPTKQMHNAH